ncbi:hypothetical protein [Curtobacterium sp. MCBD17_040]|uniref:hypothetical protein n=1 Tax=Curtobacterium sp. MCBD17_040 TaxID=2175674 RepID=UPI0011B62D70|nr:hypothetical protein [Curtobacterium sp. MCBD17_040]WIB65652.1 hypothetical protein DEI94_16155 [Curtobacterium sp. MCBD17_040]
MVITTTLASIIGGVTLFSAMTANSTESSSAFQTSDLQLAKAVHSADRVIGYGDQAVALLTNTGGSCAIDLWHGYADASGALALREDRSTVPQACDAVTTVSLAPVATGAEKVPDLGAVSLKYTNIGGRSETFSTDGTVTLNSSATQPSGVSDDDWADPRPYKVDLSLASNRSNLTAFAKNAVLTGYAKIVNARQAATSPGSLRYVPDTTPKPSAITIVDVARSTTTGAVYAGAHEGITVTFTGAQCPDATSTTVTTSFTTATPSGVPPASNVTTKVLTGAANKFELANVKNGAQGTVSISATCAANGQATTESAPFTQGVPNPTLKVAESKPFSTHVLTWNAVSSLPTAFTNTWTGDDGTSGTVPATQALTANVVHPAYGTYGVKDTYVLTATVNGESGTATASISRAWPTIPTAANFKRVETQVAPSKEHLSWGYNTTCPTGTTLYTEWSEDRTGQADGSVSNTVHNTSGYKKGLNSDAWAPPYALQGYYYGIHVYTECVINSTRASSATKNAEFDWVTGMNTPHAPKWASYNTGGYNGNAQDTHVTQSSSCTTSAAACGSWLVVTYDAYCPSGADVVNTHFRSLGWPGQPANLRGPFEHEWGYQDFWQGPGTPQDVTYSQSWYSCQTPWGLKQSSISGDDTLTVNP